MNALAKTLAPRIPTENALERVQALDWERVSHDLDAQGSAVLEHLLSSDECQALAGLYPEDSLFRSRVVMARHGFGRGEYKYFRHPLPEIIAELRRPSTRAWRPSPIVGTPPWALLSAIPKSMLTSSSDAMMPGNLNRRPCCCNTEKATTTACTRTFTANMSSPYRWPSCYRSRQEILPAGNLL